MRVKFVWEAVSDDEAEGTRRPNVEVSVFMKRKSEGAVHGGSHDVRQSRITETVYDAQPNQWPKHKMDRTHLGRRPSSLREVIRH